jgi:large subunit ribosomal protein L29
LLSEDILYRNNYVSGPGLAGTNQVFVAWQRCEVEMKAQQYREMNADELVSRLDELQRHLFDLRSQAVTEKLENSKAATNVRRDIARIKTVMQEKEIGAGS